MKKKIVGMVLCTLVIAGSMMLASTSLADWDPGDGHKMHYPQLPDVDGWDVYATAIPGAVGVVLADDWMCSESAPVSDIHFWGSWFNGVKGTITAFSVAIHADIPADQSPTGYSMPGAVLWKRTIDTWKERGYDSPGQGFYNPGNDQFQENDHNIYFQYNIVDISDPFVQKKGTIYWLSVMAFVKPADPGTFQPRWGWKSSEDHWNDDAVWSFSDTQDWIEMYEPPHFQQSLDLAFVITGEESEPCVEVEKKVWDPVNEDWVEEINATICTNVTFQLTVHNCGDFDLTNIQVYDDLPVCLEYIPGTSTPFEPSIQGSNLIWTFNGPLPYCHTITIKFDAHVISDGENVNRVTVTADSAGGVAVDVDTATVHASEKLEPDLQCEGEINWVDVKPGATVTDTIYVYNNGDTGSELDWSICGFPSWGTWTFSPNSGIDLTPAASPTAITVTVTAPNVQNNNYAGQIKICNDENASDFCFIDVSLATPKSKQSSNLFFLRFLERLIERFPLLEHVFNCLNLRV
jgi:uncharacterized repeat protein (TIGR01451 family)